MTFTVVQLRVCYLFVSLVKGVYLSPRFYVSIQETDHTVFFFFFNFKSGVRFKIFSGREVKIGVVVE